LRRCALAGAVLQWHDMVPLKPMETRAGVATSTSRDGVDAGRRAASEALERLGAAPDLVLVFATAGYELTEVLRGVRAMTGDAPLSGCSCEGIITQAGSNEGSHALCVMALASKRLRFTTFNVRGLSAGSKRCGEELAARVNAAGGGKLLVVFPDGLTLQSRQFLSSLEDGLAQPTPIVGGSAGEMLRFEHTYQFTGGEVLEDSVSAVLVDGDFEPVVEVSHGCDLIGTERTVTRADGALLHEIDRRPAWDVLREYLDADIEDLTALAVSYSCLAEKIPGGGPYGSHAIRVPLGLRKETGTLVVPGEIAEGTPIHVARRDPDAVRENALACVERIRARRPGEDPIFVWQFDCCGRGALLYGEGTNRDLIHPILRAIGDRTPLAGFHSYGEIAPVGGRACFHNYTVVLCALYAT
jgi:hypothetical protein